MEQRFVSLTGQVDGCFRRNSSLKDTDFQPCGPHCRAVRLEEDRDRGWTTVENGVRVFKKAQFAVVYNCFCEKF